VKIDVVTNRLTDRQS